MSYLVSFLGWLGVDASTWPNFGILLLTAGSLVAAVILCLLAWILVNRARRAGWTASSETSQAKARASSDALTASRLQFEQKKAEEVHASELAKIRQQSQSVIEGPQRELTAVKASLEEHKAAIAARDGTLVALRGERDQALQEIEHLKGKIASMELARATMLGDADDHRIERQQLQAELSAAKQQQAQSQAEAERLHGTLRDLIARVGEPVAR